MSAVDARSHRVAHSQTRIHESGCPQKLTKATKGVKSILCFLRLLGVQKSAPRSWRTPIGGLPGFSPSAFTWVNLRFKSDPVKASQGWSNRFEAERRMRSKKARPPTLPLDRAYSPRLLSGRFPKALPWAGMGAGLCPSAVTESKVVKVGQTK